MGVCHERFADTDRFQTEMTEMCVTSSLVFSTDLHLHFEKSDAVGIHDVYKNVTSSQFCLQL